MTPFVLHCGDCGHPLRVGDHTDCARQSGRLNADDERAALIADITAVILSMANVPPPVTPPGVGGALVPAGPTPFAPQPTANRFIKKGFYMCCVSCGLEKSFCNCAKRAAPDAQSQDAKQADASLEQRVRECKGR